MAVPRDGGVAVTGLEKAHELLLGEEVEVGVGGFGLGEGGDQLLPPGLGMVVGAKDGADRGVVDARWARAVVEGAHLFVARDVAAAVAAVGADVALDEILARELIHADALAVEPVLTSVARDHKPVVVRSAADAVGPAVGLAAVAAAAAGTGEDAVGRLLLRAAGLRALLPTSACAAGGSRGGGTLGSFDHSRGALLFLLGPRGLGLRTAKGGALGVLGGGCVWDGRVLVPPGKGVCPRRVRVQHATAVLSRLILAHDILIRRCMVVFWVDGCAIIGVGQVAAVTAGQTLPTAALLVMLLIWAIAGVGIGVIHGGELGIAGVEGEEGG